MLMRRMGETRCGIFDRALLESALARPRHAARYEGAESRNHPWLGGNKRAATILVDRFLYRNGLEVRAAVAETVEMVSAVEADRWGVGFQLRG